MTRIGGGISVLSLFDGISCGMVALERAGIKVDRYVAYEIEPNAIKISKKNYPEIEHCGDVTKADFTQYLGVDWLIGGSPCQDMSTLGNRKGLSGDKSKLFFEFARAVTECKPKFFLLENNANMPKRDKAEISDILGVDPVEINSAEFVPQNRKRLYWVGMRNLDNSYSSVDISPAEKNSIQLKEILMPVHNPIELVPSVVKKLPLLKEKFGYIPEMFNPYNMSEITDIHPCLTASGNRQTTSSNVVLYDGEHFSMLSPVEWERIQGLPDDYTKGVPDGIRKNLVGNGWTVDVIAHILKGIK